MTTLVLMVLLSQASQPPNQGAGKQVGTQKNPATSAQQQPALVTRTSEPVLPVQGQQEGTNQSASNRNSAAEWEAGGTIAGAFFALVLVVFTALQLRINWRTEKHFQTVERAYVAMHHDGRFGARIAELGPDALFLESTSQHVTKRCRVEVRVINHGNTPATVTDTWLDVSIGQPLTEALTYTRTQFNQRGRRSYLVKTEDLRIPLDFTLLAPEVDRLNNGQLRVWVYGYVDYIDAFSVAHRAGYARLINKAINPDIEPVSGFFSHGLQLDEVAGPYNYDTVLAEPAKWRWSSRL